MFPGEGDKPQSKAARFDDERPIAVKPHPWRLEEVLHDVSILVPPPPEEFGQVRAILSHDMISEYDARLFSVYIHTLGIPLSPEFEPAEELWNIDEDQHFRGFMTVNRALFGLTDEGLQEVYARQANFEPIAHLLTDEFSILLTVAYDELATVRGYKADIPIYDRFGLQFADFIRKVIADEAWHYQKFSKLITRYHRHRIPEAPELVRRIRDSEGLPYQATFVMDHTEDVFTASVLDESAEILLRHLGQFAQEQDAER